MMMQSKIEAATLTQLVSRSDLRSSSASRPAALT